MGRFSPTVTPVAAPGFGAALSDAFSMFLAAKRQRDAEDRRTIEEQQRDQLFSQQLQAAQRANRMGTRQEAVAPLIERGQLRELGYVPVDEGATNAAGDIAAGAGLMPGVGAATVQPRVQGTPIDGYVLDQSLTPDARARQAADATFGRQLSLELARERGQAIRDAANNAARHEDTRTRAGATVRAAEIRASAAANRATDSDAQLARMSPSARNRYFENVAGQALRAAVQEGVDPSSYTKLTSRAVNIILENPQTANLFGKGMTSAHINAALQRFNERPAVRVSPKDKAKMQAIQELTGGDSTLAAPATQPIAQPPASPRQFGPPATPPAPAPTPSAAAGAAAKAPPRNAGESDADYWERLVDSRMSEQQATAQVIATRPK